MKASQRIQKLRDLGYEVRVSHLRRVEGSTGLWRSFEARDNDQTLMPRGGATHVVINQNGSEIAHGIAECSPRDVFSRTIGLEIAVGRILKAVPELRDRVDLNVALDEIAAD